MILLKVWREMVNEQTKPGAISDNDSAMITFIGEGAKTRSSAADCGGLPQARRIAKWM